MDGPAHGCEGGDGRGDELCDEEVAEFGGWDEEEGELNYPEEEIAVITDQ